MVPQGIPKVRKIRANGDVGAVGSGNMVFESERYLSSAIAGPCLLLNASRVQRVEEGTPLTLD